MRRLLALLALAPLAACGEADMSEQPRAKTWDRNGFFPQAMTMRHPVAGTVPRNDPAKPAAQLASITETLLARGRERYGIYCTPCHGASGDGRGIIVARGFPSAGQLTTERQRTASADDLYRAISEGHRAMYGMGQMIPSADRWAIIAYVRALQQSQDTEVAGLPPEDRAKLEASR
ncbi:cytochrome c [Methylobacterium sp. E-016]|uniref:c-type cytochrome n=1 Tax=Methylobacterium sp. E-016 TaxID=2836556 RepID=UPI001FB873FA|nr:cytochrome c [Methylobacterium sp. E-016]MCJ2075698.1 cytochrome c [Methylobacterium sp. E-016]